MTDNWVHVCLWEMSEIELLNSQAEACYLLAATSKGWL